MTTENIFLAVSIFLVIGCIFGAVNKGWNSIYGIMLRILFFPLYLIYLVHVLIKERKRYKRSHRRPLNPWWL